MSIVRKAALAASGLLMVSAFWGAFTGQAPAAPAARPHVKSFGGVVPDVPSRTIVHARAMAHAADLPYGGGPVLHANRTHLIFWRPSGSGMSFDPGYISSIETFLKRVAADSRKSTNVYGLTGQYHDAGGPAAYNSTYGGAVDVSDPLPPNGCTEPATGPPLWLHCLDDNQLEAEIQHVINADHLPTAEADVYFLITPNGLGSCESQGPDNCALGGSADGSYCGYHSSSPDGTILYAIIPYNAVPGHCQSSNPRPNGNTADPTISTISHEHSEMVTDPLGDAWIDGSGNENGDLCISDFGPNLGGLADSAFNEVIHGGRYYLQEEWSNDDASCQPRDEPDSVSVSAPRRARVGAEVTFTASASDPDGRIASYVWFFGEGRPGRRRRSWHAFKRAGSYRVVLRTTDSSGNYAYSSRSVRITRR
jgi:hypothetical protein